MKLDVAWQSSLIFAKTTWKIATPVCGLVRNDKPIEIAKKCRVSITQRYMHLYHTNCVQAQPA